MSDYRSLSHTQSKCKYHVVFAGKCARKAGRLEVRAGAAEAAIIHNLDPSEQHA